MYFRSLYGVIFACLVLLCLPPNVIADDDRALRILGWVENVILIDPGFELKAKLDTGASTASLHATNIEKIKEQGEWQVRFTVTDPETGDEIDMEKERVDRVRIKQHGGMYQTRNVVEMEICFGNSMHLVEVNLVDRSQFVYPLLLGREALEGIAIVDPSEMFLGEPGSDCSDYGTMN